MEVNKRAMELIVEGLYGNPTPLEQENKNMDPNGLSNLSTREIEALVKRAEDVELSGLAKRRKAKQDRDAARATEAGNRHERRARATRFRLKLKGAIKQSAHDTSVAVARAKRRAS